MKKIHKHKVNEAIEFLHLSKKSGEKWGPTTKTEENLKKDNPQCKIMHRHRTKKQLHSMGISKNTILSELRSHAIKKDWSKVRNLFLILLHLSTDVEPVIWRYGFILTLYSNINNLFNISEFFKMCIGSVDSDRNLILKNLLSLSSTK